MKFGPLTRRLLAPVLALASAGCGFFKPTYESALRLDQAGKTSQALAAYQDYLKDHPGTSLGPVIYYRVARAYLQQSDYDDALKWYERICGEFSGSDEELHALLDMADLYRDKLKNDAKALEYSQRAFLRYMDNVQLKSAIQALVDAQYITANSFYTQKNYKTSSGTLDGIYRSYPTVLIAPDTRAKIDSLADRSRRAQQIGAASVDSLVLKAEVPFNKSFEQDFPAEQAGTDQALLSPDGKSIAARKRGPRGLYYLYVAKVPAKGDEVLFKLIPQTVGAEQPSWSPDGSELIYWRTVGIVRKLDKTDLEKMITRTLFMTKSPSLGVHPAYHPAGNKVAYIYEGRICLINTGDVLYKQLLKTRQNLDYTCRLAWSTDGTMIRCTQVDPGDKEKRTLDRLLLLDVAAPADP